MAPGSKRRCESSRFRRTAQSASRISYGLAALLLYAAGTAGASEHTVSVGGRHRTYSVFRPESLGRRHPVPLVVVLHGGFGNGAQAERAYRWDDTATTKGFVVAYPNGLRRSWNAGGTCCGPAYKNEVDDVAFLDAMIRAISSRENIDPRRIYLTGISNGAAMAYRYACDGKVTIAAIGSVAGTMPASCAKLRPVSVMEIHGLKDENIPFDGGVGRKGVTHIDWPPVQATLSRFRRADHCGPVSTRKTGAVERSDALCADGRAVSLITIAGAGHQWPGSVAARPIAQRLLQLDPPSTALDATATLWAFFEAHPAP